jgi:cysteate synthase
MTSAWRDRRRTIIPDIDMPDARASVEAVLSGVLTNRNPPYSITGGLFDALMDTDGVMYAVSNSAGRDAVYLIEDTVGIDPDPAAAIATAALVQAAGNGSIRKDEHILLNLTGGGYRRVKEDHMLYRPEPSAAIDPGEPLSGLREQLREWIVHHG